MDRLADALCDLSGSEIHRVAVLFYELLRVERCLQDTEPEAIAAALEQLPKAIIDEEKACSAAS